MITVILAGGSGTRLWPLSTQTHPKQLLKLINDRTMLQMTYDRAIALNSEVYIVTEASYVEQIKRQLPNISSDNIIIEPGLRGTAHCINLALDFLRRVKQDYDEAVAFVHADHYIRDIKAYVKSFECASKVATETGCITLIGVEPTFPATIFGYIKRGNGLTNVGVDAYGVDSFKEKPPYETAVQYLNDGNYLWNCGYFVGSLNIFMDAMKEFAPDLYNAFVKLSEIDSIESIQYRDQYLMLDKQVIDTALMEKTRNLKVVPSSFDWADIGSFRDLHAVLSCDENENYIDGDNVHYDGVENAYIRNEENRPIAIVGVDNIVVVNTKNGLLVIRKDISHKVGDIAKTIQKNDSY